MFFDVLFLIFNVIQIWRKVAIFAKVVCDMIVEIICEDFLTFKMLIYSRVWNELCYFCQKC